MSQPRTFDQVVDMIVGVCRDHHFVHEVYYGDPWEISTAGNVVYPHIVVVPTSVNALDKQVQYNFNIICMDLVEPGEGDMEKRVQSQTCTILLDIIAWFKRGGRMQGTIVGTSGLHYANTNSYYDYTNEISTTFTLEPFTEKFTDNVAGWNMQFSITNFFDYSVCHWDGYEQNELSIDGDGTVTSSSDRTLSGPQLSHDEFMGES